MRPSGRPTMRRAARGVVACVAPLILATTLMACGSGRELEASSITDTAAVIPIAATCPEAVLGAAEQVARRVYQESANGRIVAQAVNRLANSTALVKAVELNDPTAVRRALRGLILHQILSVQVMRGGRKLAEINRGISIAPASGRLVGAGGQVVGTFTVAVQGANGYTQTTSGLTATEVELRSGGRLLGSTLHPAPPPVALGQGEVISKGVLYKVARFAGKAFPEAPMSISLLMPSASITEVCAKGRHPSLTPTQASVDALGLVGRRIYDAEGTGGKAERILSYVEHSQAFRAAVLAGDARATRAAIVGFFGSHLHVVRVRVIRMGKLLVDVGGPYVLAPIPGTVRDARGRVTARFLLAIQDDMGFMLLAHEFTGAEVLMRKGSRQVMGTLKPGPPTVPNRGRISYRGTTYQAYSFGGEAFPAGGLRISLLFPVA